MRASTTGWLKAKIYPVGADRLRLILLVTEVGAPANRALFLRSVPACQTLQSLVQTHFSKRAKPTAWYALKMQKPLQTLVWHAGTLPARFGGGKRGERFTGHSHIPRPTDLTPG